MKRFFVLLLAGFFLLIPTFASATPIVAGAATGDSVVLTLEYTDDIDNGIYYTDYQSMVDGEKVELFCVEKQGAHVGEPETYQLYALSNADATTLTVAWLAETWWQGNFQGTYNDDTKKAMFQELIWSELDIVSLDPIDYFLYQINLGIDLSGVLEDYTGNWVLASNLDYQDYLMRAAPVPEPATMLLLGTGLVGLAGLSRRKFKK